MEDAWSARQAALAPKKSDPFLVKRRKNGELNAAKRSYDKFIGEMSKMSIEDQVDLLNQALKGRKKSATSKLSKFSETNPELAQDLARG